MEFGLSEENRKKQHDNDDRALCKYGDKCYQKNEAHLKKFKHPPKADQKQKSPQTTTKKRTWLDRKDAEEPHSKSSDAESDSEVPEAKKACVSSDSCDKTEKVSSVVEEKSGADIENKDDSVIASRSENKVDNVEAKAPDVPIELSDTFANTRKIIKEKFLVDMPEDFYKFYELCKEISPGDPSNAFKIANLLLVGPYDVLNGKLSNTEIEDKEQFLIHWRYFYDPPEFQTVIKGSDKNGLHFGYWRDEPKQDPVFVAKNLSKIDCKFRPVAETIFGAIDVYLEEGLKTVSPFDRSKFSSLRQRLRKFAISKHISLEKSTERMKAREKKVVARTFHGAGIVVPYDKKTQLGYRELAATDGHLKQIIRRVDQAEDEAQRNEQLVHLEEVERLATIAADECDFGTCLEFGHDLFSSGSKHTQSTATRMLSTAYTLLNRSEFLEIVKAHCKNRREGCLLGIV